VREQPLLSVDEAAVRARRDRLTVVDHASE
jgi:hypothetical protein